MNRYTCGFAIAFLALVALYIGHPVFAAFILFAALCAVNS